VDVSSTFIPHLITNWRDKREELREVIVEAPASSANLGSGFDTFAIALENPKDRLRVSFEEGSRRTVEINVPKGANLPLDPRENAAGVVAAAMAGRSGRKGEIRVTIEKKVPAGIGIGSSAASGAACAIAMNVLLGLKLSKDELVRYAGKGEATASGAAHYDNVSAAIYGGFVVVTGKERPSVVRLNPPAALGVCVATPQIKLPERKTEYSRSILPRNLRLGQLVANVGRASTLVAGFARGDVAMIGEGMRDEVVEPARSKLIPGYSHVRELATKAGAAGVCISGAGPSMLAAVDVKKGHPRDVLAAMVHGFRMANVKAGGFVTRVGEGARVIESG
jgi:homoserine kinase